MLFPRCHRAALVVVGPGELTALEALFWNPNCSLTCMHLEYPPTPRVKPVSLEGDMSFPGLTACSVPGEVL